MQNGWNGKKYGRERQKANILELEKIEREMLEINAPIYLLKKRRKTLKNRIKFSRQRRLGIRKDDVRMKRVNEKSKKFATLHCSRWDENDEAVLMRCVGKMKYIDIAKKLGRTRKSIKAKIYILTRDIIKPDGSFMNPTSPAESTSKTAT